MAGKKALSTVFTDFLDSEKSAAVLLIACTVVSLTLANSALGPDYLGLWKRRFAGLDLEHWINDALMAIFFLLIGLELERELHSGELSEFRNAVLPIAAAAGGVVVPALIHFVLNAGTPTQPGLGIPMATDIAFVLGILALLGSRAPASLKVFATALAVMDDLAAIVLIALFYTAQLSLSYLFGAIAVFGALLLLNFRFRVMALAPYLVGGALMWGLMLKSGVHATLAGVLLAFAIPYSAKRDDAASPSHRLEHVLHKPVVFLILPIFALANTAVVVGGGWAQSLTSANSLGILGGLIVGKPVGILLACYVAVSAGIASLPSDLGWRHIAGAGFLGGIGFTMSIFITNLAFGTSPETINASKMAILVASLASGVAGYLWLRRVGVGDAPSAARSGSSSRARS